MSSTLTGKALTLMLPCTRPVCCPTIAGCHPALSNYHAQHALTHAFYTRMPPTTAVTAYGDAKKCTVRCIAWSSDDSLLATGGEDHTARWAIRPLPRALCLLTTRRLSHPFLACPFPQNLRYKHGQHACLLPKAAHGPRRGHCLFPRRCGTAQHRTESARHAARLRHGRS